MAVTDVTTGEAFDRELAQNELTIAYFWAPWSGPCKHMDAVVAELSKAAPATAKFVRVEAEEVDAATERCGVAAVPCFVLLRKGGREVARVEGADAAGLTAAVEAACGTGGGGAGAKAAAAAAGAAAGAPAATAAPPSSSSDPANAELRAQLARRRVEALVQSNPVVLFMKGTPDAPRCGFSRRVVEAIARCAPAAGASGNGAAPAPSSSSSSFPYAHFDVLSDESVRDAVKTYADWPTIPQLYVSGEFLGGCDIVEAMAESGELREALAGATAKATTTTAKAAATPPPPSSAAAPQPPLLTPELRAQIEALLASEPLVLFMKGTPEEPRCGFSRRVVDALRSAAGAGAGVAAGAPLPRFKAVDILAPENQAVREGLKVLSDWPTYPQLYSKGELVGGCDIIEQMAQGGELEAVVRDALSA